MSMVKATFRKSTLKNLDFGSVFKTSASGVGKWWVVIGTFDDYKPLVRVARWEGTNGLGIVTTGRKWQHWKGDRTVYAADFAASRK